MLMLQKIDVWPIYEQDLTISVRRLIKKILHQMKITVEDRDKIVLKLNGNTIPPFHLCTIFRENDSIVLTEKITLGKRKKSPSIKSKKPNKKKKKTSVSSPKKSVKKHSNSPKKVLVSVESSDSSESDIKDDSSSIESSSDDLVIIPNPHRSSEKNEDCRTETSENNIIPIPSPVFTPSKSETIKSGSRTSIPRKRGDKNVYYSNLPIIDRELVKKNF